MAYKIIEAKTRAEAIKLVGGDASTLTAKVNGGYAVFNTVNDLRTFRNQK